MNNWAIKFVLLLSLSLFSICGFSEERHIHLNGEHLESNQIAIMDQLFGQMVPNGYYWINESNGQWGYEGNPNAQGLVPALVAQSYQQPSYEQESYQQAYQGSSDYYQQPEINMSQNGSVVSGRVNGRNCTYVSVQGMSVRNCD